MRSKSRSEVARSRPSVRVLGPNRVFIGAELTLVCEAYHTPNIYSEYSASRGQEFDWMILTSWSKALGERGLTGIKYIQ